MREVKTNNKFFWQREQCIYELILKDNYLTL